jgi:tetratricopeptide (TPR) repeat protein
LEYVQQARVSVDPTYYPKAEAALDRSLRLNDDDNAVAMAGEAALSAARHDFHAALTWARRGLAVDPQSAVLYGALSDALTQTGRYPQAEAAARRMEQLQPGTDAEARLSYAAELRGDEAAAVAFMQTALGDAGTPADVAFTRYYLAELALMSGHPHRALHEITVGLALDPSSTTLLEGRAKAEAALGRAADATQDLATVVSRVPQPNYVLEYGELLQSLGRAAEAAQEYALFRVEEKLFAGNGVTLDTDETLFEADHGDVALAVAVGRAATRSRPFVDSYDAYGWALHRSGRDREALAFANRSLAPGVHNALFFYHRAAIEKSLRLHALARRDASTAVAVNPAFSPLLTSDARRIARAAAPR